MLKIKLTPRGKKHQVTYRIVIAEQHSKSNGKFTDEIGFYTPQTKTLNIDKDKMTQWIKNGAQLTEGVDKLLNPNKYPKKIKRVKVVKEPKIKAEVTATDIKAEETK